MAIQVATLGGADLRIATPVLKRNYTTAISVGGAAGQVVGHWRAFWVRLPSTWAGSGRPAMMGADNAGTATFGATIDTVVRIPHESYSVVATRRRIQLGYASTVQVYTTTEGDVGSISQFGYLVPTLVIDGVVNTGTNAAPVWRNFVAVCPTGGTPETFVAPTASVAAWLTGTTGRLFHQIFCAQSTGTTRTPVGTALEHAALATGDFPWDTVNARPHHDAIQALAASGANPFFNYQGLIDAQNAGSLPYANLRSNGDAANPRPGRSELSYWYTLKDFTTGLANAGTVAATPLTQNTVADAAGLTAIAVIAPSHWAGATADPAIGIPAVRFHGGRGSRPLVRTGTYDALNTPGLQRRWVFGTGAVNGTPGAVVTGYDWGGSFTLNAGTWSLSDTLPVGGPYTLEVRDTAVPSRAAIALADNIVGTIVTFWGQSGAALALRTGYGSTTLGPNLLNVAVASGALGVAMRLDSIDANGSGAYIRPLPGTAVLRQGTTPAVGHGFVAMVNEWNNHNPGHPLGIVVPAINGTSMEQWATDSLVLGSASWKFVGTKTVPGAAAADTSGVVGYHALLMGSYTDVHLMMWTGIAETLAIRASWTAAVDAMFTGAPSAPWLVFPPWRGHRDLPDGSATTKTRTDSVDYVSELGSRGALGPYWPDIVSDGSSSLHAAHNTSAGNPNTGNPVSDGNSVGQGKLGRGIGRAVAWFWDRKIKAGAFSIAGAWFVDGGRTQIRVELGRQVRTLNAAAMANRFSISTDNGVTWPLSAVGFTAALDAGARSVTLTINTGSWAATNVRVDYCREWPFPPSQLADEANAEASLHGLLYDNQVFRGNTNLASPAGNVLASTNRIGAGVAGAAVAAKAAAKLVTSARFAGTRNVLVRMMTADGVTVLREKSLTITAS